MVPAIADSSSLMTRGVVRVEHHFPCFSGKCRLGSLRVKECSGAQACPYLVNVDAHRHSIVQVELAFRDSLENEFECLLLPRKRKHALAQVLDLHADQIPRLLVSLQLDRGPIPAGEIV